MGGNTDMIDLDSTGAPPGILDGWGHSYDTIRLNRGTFRYFDGWEHSYDRLRLIILYEWDTHMAPPGILDGWEP